VRLKRLIRQHSDLVDRLRREGADPLPRAVVSARLYDLEEIVRQGWRAERRASDSRIPVVDDHVEEALRQIGSWIARLGQPDMDLGVCRQGFQAVAVPLLFVLRGLDEVGEEVLGGGWAEPEPVTTHR